MKFSQRVGLLLFICVTFILVLIMGGQKKLSNQPSSTASLKKDQPYLVLLGIAQDAGYPQASCHKACCKHAWNDHQQRRNPCCAAIVDPKSGKRWLLDCTPSFPQQLRDLDNVMSLTQPKVISGIFLTHAHIGHYAGLIHLGREVMGMKNVSVHVMPRMRAFLESNGPWSQLVQLNNITLQPMIEDQPVKLTDSLSVTPMLVPHRGEFFETVAFLIRGPSRSVLYLPDIDRWSQWNRKIEEEIAGVDRAYLDGTFFSGDELPGRDMSRIPHPTISESMNRFSKLATKERDKIHFFHLNHTNPALHPASKEAGLIEQGGFHVAREGDLFGL